MCCEDLRSTQVLPCCAIRRTLGYRESQKNLKLSGMTAATCGWGSSEHLTCVVRSAVHIAGAVVRLAGPTGTETLKNLVLGGIKAFTIVDSADVTASDFGNSFMLEPEASGKRAAAVAGPLRELNESVVGGCVEEDAMALLDAQADFFDRFSLVIATQVRYFIFDRSCLVIAVWSG